MIGHCEWTPLTELLSAIVDNRGRTCPTADTGIPLIATNCIRNDLLYPAHEKVRFVTGDTYRSWFRGHPLPGDLLFVTKGTPGRVCMVPDPVDFCVAQDMVALRADETRIYPRYLFAVLRSPGVQADIERMHVGTLIPHFKKGDFDKLLLPLVDRTAQEFIGDLYFELSDKIELNRRMNATLEAMARAIFQSWFVDFDPVRANAEGRETGLPAEIAALFPDGFVASELGEIPAGWENSGLDSIARFLNGLALQKYPPASNGIIPVIKIAQLRAGHTVGADSATAAIPSDYVVSDSDVLFSWSGSLECVLWAGGAGALNQHLFKVTSDSYPKWFYYFWIHEHLNDFRHIAAGKATTMGHIQRHHLTDAKVVVPSQHILEAANESIGPLLERSWRCKIECRNLAAIRDTLLPRLVSGELRVTNFEGDVAPLM